MDSACTLVIIFFLRGGLKKILSLCQVAPPSKFMGWYLSPFSSLVTVLLQNIFPTPWCLCVYSSTLKLVDSGSVIVWHWEGYISFLHNCKDKIRIFYTFGVNFRISFGGSHNFGGALDVD